MQNNQLSTKKLVETKYNSNVMNFCDDLTMSANVCRLQPPLGLLLLLLIIIILVNNAQSDEAPPCNSLQ